MRMKPGKPGGREECAQVVHGCRQLVSGDVGLSPATSATPAPCCQHSVGDSWGTAGAKPEEGGDDVKSSCPLCPGLHTCYNGRHNGLPPREGERIPQSRPQFGPQAATRLREAGVASNRGSARRGECVPGPCTHRPSHHPSRLHPKPPAEPARGGGVEGVEGEGGEVVTR